MKVTFYSNFLTHHQIPFCIEMQKRLGDDFKFVSTMKIFQWRLDMGFEDLDQKYDFVVRAYESEGMKVMGEFPFLIMRWLFTIIIVFPDGFFNTVLDKEKLKLFYNRHIKYRKNKNLHLLCANAYGAKDFNFLGLYKNKTYKWGYFLETNHYDIDKLIDKKEENKKIQIIWVARYIKWKHPEVVVKLAKDLKKQNYNFKIQMLGTGKLEEKIKSKIKKQNLEDVIEVVGHVPSDKVKDYMEKANIFIGTSASQEGWGAVINESMNAGCVVIANRKMGSVPFLIENNHNGIIYNSYKGLETSVKKVINNKVLRRKLSTNAYEFITQKWTGEVAANNIIKLFENILNGEECEIKDGPASREY